MKDLLKIMLIPIVGCIAIGVMFLFIAFGGYWNEDMEQSKAKYDMNAYGSATATLAGATDGILTNRGECDGSTFRPVCGHDGNTYDNACFAVNDGGTTVAHLGQCGSRV